MCFQSKSPCTIALNNGGSKAPIWLSGRGESCLTFLLNQAFWAKHCADGDRVSPIQPSLSENGLRKLLEMGYLV